MVQHKMMRQLEIIYGKMVFHVLNMVLVYVICSFVWCSYGSFANGLEIMNSIHSYKNGSMSTAASHQTVQSRNGEGKSWKLTTPQSESLTHLQASRNLGQSKRTVLPLPSNIDKDHIEASDSSSGSIYQKRPKRSPAKNDFQQENSPILSFLGAVENQGSNVVANVYCRQDSTKPPVSVSVGINLTSDFYISFSGNSLAAVYTANLLSSFYSRQRSNDSVFYNVNCLYASIRNNVENYPFVSGSCVAFDDYKFSGDKQLYAPCVFVESTGHLMEQDLGKIYDYTDTSSDHYTEWFTKYTNSVVQPPEVRWGHLIPRLNATFTGTASNTSYAFVGEGDGLWGPPYFDCNRTNRWLVTYSVPFFDHKIRFMGVVTVDVDVQSIDINQCDDGTGVFAGTHRCSNTTKCVHIPGKGFRRGSYKCICRDRFYFPHKGQPGEYFQGTDVEQGYRLYLEGRSSVYAERFACLPCQEGCEKCTDNSPCFLENDILLRTLILAAQGICIFLTGVLISVVFKYKNLKVINCDSSWMLVVILFGALLLYSELVVMFFHPAVSVCFLQHWLRGWGFAIAYGMLILKIYRKLAIFQTRSATRVLVRDRDVLKWLVLIVIVLTGYLAAWTAFSVQSMRNCNVDIVTTELMDDGMKFSMCVMEWWDYVIEIIEFLFLLFGIYLCYSVRAAPSEFHETRYISVAIYNETIFSTFLYISRHFLWSKVAPDWIFLMYFLRSQLTTTVMLALIFIPKIKVIHKLLHDESFRERVNSRVVYDGKWHNSFRRPNSSSSNINNDHNFNPEDVREELKRLYTQLEVYKTKSLRIDNPHLPSKKKSNVSKWRAPRRFSRGYSLRTHSGHSESERSSEVARSSESLGKAVELHDYRANHMDPTDQTHCSSQKWLCQQ